MPPIIVPAFGWGLVLSAVLFAVLLGVLRANPEIMLNDYPPDVRARWGPISPRSRRQRTWVALLIFALLALIVFLSTRALPRTANGRIPFVTAFVHFLVMLGTFNVLDWLALDWPLVYWRPRFLVLPGTEGMAGYSSYWFHFRGFLIGLPIITVGSALFAGLAMLVM